jgi:ATP-dependent Clp protease ATP-binding subunit ClpC
MKPSLTDKARYMMLDAYDRSYEPGSESVYAQHVLSALVAQEDNTATAVMSRLGIDLARLRGQLPAWETTTAPQSPKARHVLEAASREARELGSESLGTEHILLGLLQDQEGPIGHFLRENGIDAVRFKEALIEHRRDSGPQPG